MKETINLQKIFLSPPKSIRERAILFVMLVVTFMIFFGPIKFTAISPLKAILTAMPPSLTVSWGWIVLLRFLYRKSEFIKKS